MDSDNIDLLKTDLTTLATNLRRALIDRPLPAGEPWPEVFDAVQDNLDRLGKAVPPLVAVSNDLFDRLLPQRAAEPELKARLAALSEAAAALADGYHELWRRPFPPGMELGQMLLAAVRERLLRDYLGALLVSFALGWCWGIRRGEACLARC